MEPVTARADGVAPYGVLCGHLIIGFASYNLNGTVDLELYYLGPWGMNIGIMKKEVESTIGFNRTNGKQSGNYSIQQCLGGGNTGKRNFYTFHVYYLEARMRTLNPIPEDPDLHFLGITRKPRGPFSAKVRLQHAFEVVGG